MQDTKNIVLAIVLCLVVVFGWSSLAQYMGWIPAPDPALMAQQEEMLKQQAQEEAKRKEEAEKAALIPMFKPAEGQDIAVETPLFKAVFYSGGGTLRSFELKKYRTSLDPKAPFINVVSQATAAVAPLGLVVNSQPSWSTGKWAADSGDLEGLRLEGGEQGTITVNGEVDDVRVKRQFSFAGNSYLLKETLVLHNTSSQTRSVRVGFTVAADGRNASGDRYDLMRLAWDNNGNLNEESDVQVLSSSGKIENGSMLWVGAMSTYFLAAIVPEKSENSVFKGRVHEQVFRAALEPAEIVLPPNAATTVKVNYWLGPKDRKQLTMVNEELAKSVDLGMFSMIAKGLLWILQNFYDFVHNWGVAIILLTFVIKAIFWPLTAKSYASMEKMKKLQPRMQEIRDKYKNDKEKMNKEVMNLYRTYGVNPASGCVPILIQLPVFFGLYQALLTFIELRHAPFLATLPGTDILWLADLSAKDPLYITPILMGVTMVVQQKMSPPAADPMQRKIMMFLPIVFTLLFLAFPSGLVLYWIVNNILSIFQQWLMMRKSTLR
ncbi:MAG: membrane protein insertase YidC [Desulfovibrio sp.]|nr:membrane protein insertase YidC [Desulfovibrio sp.]